MNQEYFEKVMRRHFLGFELLKFEVGESWSARERDPVDIWEGLAKVNYAGVIVFVAVSGWDNGACRYNTWSVGAHEDLFEDPRTCSEDNLTGALRAFDEEYKEEYKELYKAPMNQELFEKIVRERFDTTDGYFREPKEWPPGSMTYLYSGPLETGAWVRVVAQHYLKYNTVEWSFCDGLSDTSLEQAIELGLKGLEKVVEERLHSANVLQETIDAIREKMK